MLFFYSINYLSFLLFSFSLAWYIITVTHVLGPSVLMSSPLLANWLLLVLVKGLYFEITEYAHFLLYDHVAFALFILGISSCLWGRGVGGEGGRGMGE